MPGPSKPPLTTARPRIVSVGECMVELSRREDGRFALAYGGDTFNSSVYMARLGGDVAYLTALGDDPYSDGIVRLAEAEGIDTTLIRRIPGRMPGLYLIETAAGERSFWYWRDRAPARELFDCDGAVTRARDAFSSADAVYFSGVTLSLYGPRGLDAFADLLAQARAARATIVMDSNYRPRGWAGEVARARATFERFWRLADVALPTYEDEAMLWGDPTPTAALDRLRQLGPAIVVLKRGADGAIVDDAAGRRDIPCPARVTAVDTTAAGDAFNGAFLCAMLSGVPLTAAVTRAHALAGVVVRHHGAIIPRDVMPAPS